MHRRIRWDCRFHAAWPGGDPRPPPLRKTARQPSGLNMTGCDALDPPSISSLQHACAHKFAELLPHAPRRRGHPFSSLPAPVELLLIPTRWVSRVWVCFYSGPYDADTLTNARNSHAGSKLSARRVFACPLRPHGQGRHGLWKQPWGHHGEEQAQLRHAYSGGARAQA